MQATEFDSLDTRFYKQDLERLQRIDEDIIRNEYVRSEQEKQRRESAAQIDDFFETPVSSFPLMHNARVYQHAPYIPAKTMQTIEEVPKLGMWEEIASSIQKLDPENVEMIGSLAAAAINTSIPHIKVEITDESTNSDTYNNILQPVTVKSEKLPPLHSPSSTQLMTPPNSSYNTTCHSVPQQYHSYKTNLYSSIPSRIMYPCPGTQNNESDTNSVNNIPRRTPPPPYPIPSATPMPRSTQRYNRRNNPELEKRRIHHCNFLGMLSTIFVLLLEHLFK